MNASDHLRVTYLELLEAPRPASAGGDPGRIRRERLSPHAYLALYRRVGGPLRWDTRLNMPAAQLEALLAGENLHIFVLRVAPGDAAGFCEFDRSGFPEIELTHFGLAPEAQGRGLGPRLLARSLRREWQSGARRIWLHTDAWDHPAAVPVYERAGFRVYDVRYEPAQSL
jgi:GNAT superfamily N-acetyltransferase